VEDPARLAELREGLHARAAAAGLKGTILLAGEGINLFLAGPPEPLRAFMADLRDGEFFGGLYRELHGKESWSSSQPFRKLLVKIKREIIRMNHPAIRPAASRAPALSPETLARWLDAGHDDEGREVLMLDTRNAFELEYGAFEGALDWKLHKFSDFPEALHTHREDLQGKTVVSYCTGGIRCEKAALLMAEAGVGPVWQLEGGILKYLESQQGRPGARHYRGACFVFDERIALDGELAPHPGPGEQGAC
jgi:UPF0176 protein